MKILVSPPKNKNLFYHEAQTARKARYIISGLQLLSGATALIGIRIYFSDWLDDMNPIMQIGVMAIIAFVLVAPGEMGIRETWAYLFRAVLNRFNSGLNLFSLILMGFVAIFLTSYSFYLSQHATKNSMRRAAPKIQLADTKDVSASYNAEVKRLTQEYGSQRNDVNQRYQELIVAENEYYDNMIAGNEAEIDRLRKKGWATGTRFTTKMNALETKNRNLETKRSENLKNLKEKQNSELVALESWRRNSEDEAKSEKNTNKSNIQNQNEALVKENTDFANMFSTLIARFAAWSVILVILFTGYLEIFYYKTGIKRVVQFKSTDFQAPIFLELLVFPYVYFSRYLTNFVRKRYNKLPEIVPAPGTEDLVDHDREDFAQDFAQDFAPEFNARSQEQEPSAVKTKTNKNKDSVNHLRTELDSIFNAKGEAIPSQKKPRPKPKAEDPPKTNTTFFNQHRKPDQEPKAKSSGLSDDLAAIFNQSRTQQNKQEEERTQLDDISFGQEIDYNASLKHVNRRTGQVQYLSMDDLDEKLERISSKMDDASEMYQDTGDPMYLAAIEECRSGLSYWQSRKVELHQRMHKEASFF